jgi:hypothetical protein
MAKSNESGWGGKRPGAGRKRRLPYPVDHRKRPKIDPNQPLLVTKRVMDDIALDDAETWSIVERSVSESVEGTPGFEVQRLTYDGQEVLFLVSAKSKKVLTRGMQAVSVRIAHRLNRLYGRTGCVFVARYQVEALEDRRAVERALSRF